MANLIKIKKTESGDYLLKYDDNSTETKKMELSEFRIKNLEAARNKKKLKKIEENEIDNYDKINEVINGQSGDPIKAARIPQDSPSKKGAKSWRPSGLLPVSGKDPNFVYRWVRKRTLDKKVDEGWIFVPKGEVNAPMTTVMDGKSSDSTIQKRELILMKLPKHMNEERKEYYRKRQVSIEDTKSALQGAQGMSPNSVYGTVSQY